MPEIFSLALFERSRRTLVACRKTDKPPFAGRWVLPGAAIGADESAEEALERHCYAELGVEIEMPEFVETLYLEDQTSARRYVANIFRVRGHQGKLRFRAAGDYDDARWLADAELAKLSMPPALLEWLRAGRRAPVQVHAVPVPAAGYAPDNRAAWNAIAPAYQERYKVPMDRLVYAPRCPGEDELGLLGDVSSKRVLVLGCGGGQDCIVLAKQGAQVIGIDLSDKQIEYGRRLSDREGVLVTLLQGNVEQLREIENNSQDVVLSLQALNYVEHADRAFAEAYRVLRPASPLVFSVHHPFDACLDDEPPYAIAKGYWQPELDWQWEFSETNVAARMRSWYRTISDWFMLLTDAGFRVERLLEPKPTEEAYSPWDRGHSLEKMRLVPATLIMKAVKP